jgi:predicted nucleic acid-binding protein
MDSKARPLEMDAMIAATARVHGLTVATKKTSSISELRS